MTKEPPLTTIVADCLHDVEERGEPALREACQRYPQFATQLQRAVEMVRDLTGMTTTSVDHDELFADRYRIGTRIGIGGMGTVYQATDTKLDREVALKQVRLEFAGVEEVRQRFDLEVRAATRVEHPNLCRVYDGGVWEGMPFMAMELIEGETLHRRIHEGKPDQGDQSELLRYVERIANALHAVHEEGMLHRDVKPANIMLRTNDEPVLLDFGLARDVASAESLTRVGFEPGTWSYMSPEQISPKGEDLDRRTDVYSLGLVLYECLTRTRAFDGGSEHELKTQILKEMPAPVRRLNPRVAKELGVVVVKAIAKDRADRYATAAEFAEDLRRVQKHEPITAKRFGPALRTWRWSQRNPMLASALMILIVGMTTSTVLYLETRDQRREIRANLADSAFLLADRHAQRGNWHQALAGYLAAEEAGYEDEVGLAIGRIVAWENSDQIPKAITELARLGTGEDLGRHRARVLLLSANIDVNRLRNPNQKVDLVKLAVSLGLSESDELFAKALLAPTVGESITHLQKALAIQPSNRRAIELLGNLSLVSGRLDIGRTVLHKRQALYPDDPTNIIFEAFLVGMGRDTGTVTALLENATPAVREMVQSWLPFMEDAARLIRSVDEMQVRSLIDPKFNFQTSFMREFGGFLGTALAMLKEKRLSRGGMTFRITPAFAKTAHALIRAMGAAVLFPNSLKYVETLLDAGETLGDGMFHFGAGTVLLYARKLDEAEAAFRAAIEHGSAVVSRLTMELHLLELDWQRAVGASPGERHAARAGANATISSILEQRVIGPDVLRYVFRVAESLGARQAGHEVALRWNRQFPKDGRSLLALKKAYTWMKPPPPPSTGTTPTKKNGK